MDATKIAQEIEELTKLLNSPTYFSLEAKEKDELAKCFESCKNFFEQYGRVERHEPTFYARPWA